MLTKEAFNALLKTLEEPPAHVIFILATTEVYKLPETIISRTQRFAFKPVDMPKVIAHLRHIATEEKIDVTDEALGLIAAHGEGSFRDSISLLDQIRNIGHKVDLADVQAVLGIAPTERIADMLASLNKHDSLEVAQGLVSMHDQGYEPTQIAKQLGSALRSELLAGKLPLAHGVTMKLLSQLVLVPASPDPRVALEIALLDAAFADTGHSDTAAAKVMHQEVQTQPAIQISPPRKPATKPKTTEDKTVLTDESWALVLNAVKQRHNTIFSLVKAARPQFEPGRVTLEFGYAFHQKRLNENRNKELLTEVITNVTGSNIHIHCTVGKGVSASKPALPPTAGEVVHSVTEGAPAPPPPRSQTGPVEAISNIFGGAELLES